MNDQQAEPDAVDPSSTMMEGFDVILAMLLLSRRLHIEDLSFSGADRAQVELSGEAIMQGLSAMTQIMNVLPGLKGQTEAKKEESAPSEAASSSIWQALKDFALPPPAKSSKKK